MSTSNHSTTSNGRTPPSTTVEFLAWVVSLRCWVLTALSAGAVALTIGAIGRLQYDLVFTAVVAESLTAPVALLAVFLAGRAVASLSTQWRRDRLMRQGTSVLSTDVSLPAVITVASFNIVGLIAAGVALPIIYEISGPFFYLALGLAIVTVPIGYLLIAYQLHELIAADRYDRGYRVMPAAWFYAVSMPWIVAVWFALTDVSLVTIPLPAAIETTVGSYADGIPLTFWGAVYAGLIAPTLLAFLYALRRSAEAILRTLLT
ncbi:hypothetical protein [Natranaeroarchaeum aerophilus]|uniref:Uncharacterized protein n=1 Tax=Natranaeroarchaeum aerophilus TaxID=2917711 RepID=A0AAE3FSM7_9EURY|nr:hypothetical protein [Natranaeroarchaeum aerophilus]MCL9814431.1 hypothetical protein [Natranaeroarchaeum aerophilus]